ncbi:DNA mismatch repair protein MutS, partial [PVC group bacterium]|nr:DNA mismatch repair protein MutS [PVC group bacterium]
MSASYTPMIEQYLSIKNKIKDTILFFRLGDFYEMFFEDAKIASRVLDLTLTARDGGKGIKVPMAGLPYHAAENYIHRLIKAGHKVAICEQVEDPHLSKGLVKREIVRTITPGTAVAHSVLDSKDNNFLASVNQFQNEIGISWADVSTGEFFLSSLSSYDQVRQLLSKFQIKEVILPEGLDPASPLACLAKLPDILITKYDCSCFIPDLAEKVLKEHFHVHALEGMLGTHVSLSALGAAGAIVNYLKELHKDQLGHINRIKLYTETDFMVLDSASERNLELVRNLRNQGRDCTLLSVIDDTLTSMGARLLKRWILNPLKNMSEIEKRLDGVEEFREHKELLLDVRDILRPINDMERIVGRLECGLANARDLLSLSQSIEHIKKLQSLSGPAPKSVFENIKNKIPDLGQVKDLIDKTIREDAPMTLKDGHLIKEGYDTDLDELRSIAGGGKDWIRNLQLKEIERTGIKSLKVRYNKVFGYYIEVTKTNMDLVPDDYIRKQTLVNAERFITPELKEKEALVLGAQEKIVGLEYDIFMKIRSQVCRDTKPIQKTSRLIAYVDSLTGLAAVAVKNGYVRPEITEDDTIRIEEGRHPVVEQLLEQGHFIANDTCFDHDQNRLLVITGPNSGKLLEIFPRNTSATREVSITNSLEDLPVLEPAWSFPTYVFHNSNYFQAIATHTSETAVNEPPNAAFWVDLGTTKPDTFDYQYPD